MIYRDLVQAWKVLLLEEQRLDEEVSMKEISRDMNELGVPGTLNVSPDQRGIVNQLTEQLVKAIEKQQGQESKEEPSEKAFPYLETQYDGTIATNAERYLNELVGFYSILRGLSADDKKYGTVLEYLQFNKWDMALVHMMALHPSYRPYACWYGVIALANIYNKTSPNVVSLSESLISKISLKNWYKLYFDAHLLGATQLPKEETQQLEKRDLISVIKFVREKYNIGLRTAKDVVTAMAKVYNYRQTTTTTK